MRGNRAYLDSQASRCGWERPAAPLGHATDGPHSALHHHLREFFLLRVRVRRSYYAIKCEKRELSCHTSDLSGHSGCQSA